MAIATVRWSWKLARQGCLLPVESGRPGGVCRREMSPKGKNVRALIHTGIPCKGAQATRKFLAEFFRILARFSVYSGFFVAERRMNRVLDHFSLSDAVTSGSGEPERRHLLWGL